MSDACVEEKKKEEEEEAEELLNEVSYENQTELFRLIGRKDFTGATERIRSHPHECRVWIVTKYLTGGNSSRNLFSGSFSSSFSFSESSIVAPNTVSTTTTVWYRRLPLHHAAGNKAVPSHLIQALIESYPEALMEKDETGKIPLIHACRRETSVDVMRALLLLPPPPPSTPAEDPSSPMSSLSSFPFTTEELAGYPDDDGRCALHYACEYRMTLTKIIMLTEANPSVLRHRDSYGRTPLHWECAIVNDRIEKLPVMRYLVEQYPEAVHEEDSDHQTPLQMVNLVEVSDFLRSATAVAVEAVVLSSDG